MTRSIALLILFTLLRSPGCRYLPDMSQGLWNRETLRKAAADVWRDRWAESADDLTELEVFPGVGAISSLASVIVFHRSAAR